MEPLPRSNAPTISDDSFCVCMVSTPGHSCLTVFKGVTGIVAVIGGCENRNFAFAGRNWLAI